METQKANGTVNKNLWPASTLETEAFYSPTNNSINVMLGLLGDDFYRNDMSKEQLYASIGTIIGHEISHAFDPSGAHFDKNGDMKDRWTEEDLTVFEKRAAKLIDFYDGITVFDDVNVIGSNVKGEVVADIAGMKVILSLAEKEEEFDEFSETYNLKDGDGMYLAPENRVAVW